MSISTPFIHRPVGTSLLTAAIALAGILAYFLLPVAPLPEVEFPTISVNAGLPGASPETMASSVATPLERQFGRIAGVTEMTSTSSLGSTNITLQFSLDRDINAAARDVQAAINGALGNLPANLPGLPRYRKVNPADSPVLMLTLTSDAYDRAHMYDVATTILEQKLSQVDGVGQVSVWGGANPAVRVEINPTALNGRKLSLEDVRTALAAANANRPKGEIQGPRLSYSLGTTDQLLGAAAYRNLIIGMHDGAPVRVGDVATVVDSTEDVHNSALADGKPAVLLAIFRQPDANIIDTVDRVKALLPEFRASIPAAMDLKVVMDRTTTIRASVDDVEFTLLMALLLVVLVVFVFLRDWRSTLIPGVAVPVSLLGTTGVMYLLGYSLDNLSLMALTISTGFVVDDAIVVVENITRHLEAGMKPMAAALRGAQEIGFTVMSISISLVAVFIPILLMGGIVGRLFREFAVTLSVAIFMSMIVSLTTTPMMCAILLKHRRPEEHGRIYRFSEWVFDRVLWFYEWSLAWVLRHRLIMLVVTILTIVVTGCLFYVVPKGFFPEQDVGRLGGSVQTDQDASFQSMTKLQSQYARVVGQDPAVDSVMAFANTGGVRFFVSLKPLSERVGVGEVINRLRRKLAGVPGATLYLAAQQDLRFGGRSSRAMYQYALTSDNLQELESWAPKVLEQLKKIPGVVDLNSDQQDAGVEAHLEINRETAARLGISTSEIDSVLYDAFGQRQVSTMYTELNQYHVVMEVAPEFAQSPDGFDYTYLKAADGTEVPLSALVHYSRAATATSVGHQGVFPCVTLSFNLLPGVSLGDAVEKIQAAEREMGVPASLHGSFAGTAQAFQDSFATLPLLFIAAIVAVYIVLGMLYESLIHPVTILSTLPSAGVGALLALLLFHVELSLMADIGIILLIGIVKKNAIMMIDFALEVERREKTSPAEAIYQAALLRFRPILMTTMAAMFGGLPLALGTGTGSELRRPLGIAIVGGLIFSQMLTLYTTPVIYLYLDRLRLWVTGQEASGGQVPPTHHGHGHGFPVGAPAEA
ncbi:MAG TPA: multidrug efflux RND transporter permease subunit [Phycisphaerae bacterium]|nr:multidrug efflux RND transporter permease subunit [Phycisphaerae bacterium]